MDFYVMTLFPDMITDGLSQSITGRAIKKGLISVRAVNIRDYTTEKHGKVDDYPFGGGAGMVMQVQPIHDCYKAVMEMVRGNSGRTHACREEEAVPSDGAQFARDAAAESGTGCADVSGAADTAGSVAGNTDMAGVGSTDAPETGSGTECTAGSGSGAEFTEGVEVGSGAADPLICNEASEGTPDEYVLSADRSVVLHPRVLYMSPQGRRFDQSLAEELAREDVLVFLCGHYEGVDERALTLIGAEEVSLGDFVLTGGELPAMCMIDCISRLIPGVLAKGSAEEESFSCGLLEYPQYSRPEVYCGLRVPEVLLSGHHGNVDKWRREQSIIRTYNKRPELLEGAGLDKKERIFLENYIRECK